MKASQFIMAKGLINENEDLIKYAEAIEGTEYDIEFMTKEAAPLFAALKAGGKMLMTNNVIRNAAIGTGVGAVAGAANAQEGQRMSGALKGGLIGAAVGGLGTAGKNIYNLKQTMPNVGVGQLIAGQGKKVLNTAQRAGNVFQTTMKP